MRNTECVPFYIDLINTLMSLLLLNLTLIRSLVPQRRRRKRNFKDRVPQKDTYNNHQTRKRNNEHGKVATARAAATHDHLSRCIMRKFMTNQTRRSRQVYKSTSRFTFTRKFRRLLSERARVSLLQIRYFPSARKRRAHFRARRGVRTRIKKN